MRDPLTDPRPGDVVQGEWSERFAHREVNHRAGDEVGYRNAVGAGLWCWLPDWQSWCRKTKAVVLTRGEE